MGVPYSDEALSHYWKCAFDGGEYGLGRLANQLELGCDCLGAIHYFDIPSVNDFGEPIVIKNAVCMHEEDYGTLWKHYEFRNGLNPTRITTTASGISTRTAPSSSSQNSRHHQTAAVTPGTGRRW
jgi:primary-amine oxidase